MEGLPASSAAKFGSQLPLHTLMLPYLPTCLLNAWVTSITTLDLSATPLTTSLAVALSYRLQPAPHVHKVLLAFAEVDALKAAAPAMMALSGMKHFVLANSWEVLRGHLTPGGASVVPGMLRLLGALPSRMQGIELFCQQAAVVPDILSERTVVISGSACKPNDERVQWQTMHPMLAATEMFSGLTSLRLPYGCALQQCDYPWVRGWAVQEAVVPALPTKDADKPDA